MYNSIPTISKYVNDLLLRFEISSPPVNPKKIAQLLNIEVLERNFSDDVSGALTFKNEKPLILCNVNHSENRRRFTVAHELGHFVLNHGREGIFIDKQKHFIFRNEQSATGEKRQEVEANAFAASLLMPEKIVETEMQNLINKNGFDLYDDGEEEFPFIKDLARIFQVSPMAMAFRITNLGLLNNF